MTKRISARANRAGKASACISVAAKRANATGTGTGKAAAAVFKLRFTEDSVFEDTQAHRLFRAKPVARWPPTDGQPTLAIRVRVTECD